MFASPRSRSILLPSGRVHLLDWHDDGSGEQPVVVLLHGFAQTAHSFDEYAASLGEHGIRVVALDARGHGRSDWARDGDYGRDALVGDVEGVLEALGLQRDEAPPLVIAGMSMSAGTTVALAADRGERLPSLRALVLIDWAPWPEDAQGRGSPEAGVQAIVALFQRSWPSFEEAVAATRRFNPRRSEANIRARLTHSLREREDGRWVWNTDPALLESPVFRGSEPPRAQWAAIAAVRWPCLVVRGARSDVLASAQAERLARALPAGRLAVVPDAGHSVAGDNPTGFAAAVTPFLREHLE